MTVVNDFLAERGIYMLTMILFFLGVYGIATCGNYMKKLICMLLATVLLVSVLAACGADAGLNSLLHEVIYRRKVNNR